MIDNIKKSFDILVKNTAVMQSLVLFMLFLLIFNMFMGMSVLVNPVMGIIFVVLSVLLFSAFLSGWLYIIKFAVDNYTEFDKNDPEYFEKIRNYNIETYKKFFIGVGEYFISAIIVIIFSIIISNLLIFLGMKLLYINNLDFLFKSMYIQSVQDIPGFSLRQSAFVLYIALISFLFHFITLFWLPEIFYKTKSSILAFFKSIGFLFKNFLTSVILYAFLILCFFVFQIMSVFAMFNQILVLIMFILFLYLIAYSVVLIFMTYKKNNDKREVENINSKEVFIKTNEGNSNDV